MIVMDERSEILKEGKFPNERERFEDFFDSVDDAMEAAIADGSAYKLLDGERHEVKFDTARGRGS